MDIEELAGAIGLAAELEVRTGVVRPGDTVIVGFNRRITDAENDEMLSRLKDIIPDVRFVAFPEVNALRVFRPDGEEM